MAHSYRVVQPDVLTIGSAKREKIRKRLQEGALNWRTVPMYDADETAQSKHLSVNEKPILAFKRGRSRRRSAQWIPREAGPRSGINAIKSSGLMLSCATC